MLDLTRQLAEFGAYLDAEHPTPEVAAVIAEAERHELHPDGEVTWPLEEFVPAQRLEALPTRRPRRRWMVAAAAAAVVLVLVGGIGLLARLFRAEPDVTEPATTTVAPTTTVPDLEPEAFLGAAGWQLVTGFAGTDWFHGGVSTEWGFVAWGDENPTPDVAGAGTLWHSPDGVSWSEVLRESGARFGDVAATSRGLIAVGYSPCRNDVCTSAPTIWVSTDGATWRVAERFEEPGPSVVCCGFSAIEALGSRLVVLGGDVRYFSYPSSDGIVAGCGQAERCTVAAWISDDGGATWSRHPFIDGQAQVFDLVAAGPGLVAVGAHWGAGALTGTPAVWYSVDGEAWTLLEHPGGSLLTRGAITSVTAGGPGIVAVGRSEDDQATVWTSPNGVDWSAVLAGESVSGRLFGVAGLPSGSVVAVGQNCDPVEVRNQCGAGVWNSPDGLTWVAVPHDEPVFRGGRDGMAQMIDVAVGPAGVLAVGDLVDVGQALAWTATTVPVGAGTASPATTTQPPSAPTGEPVAAAALGVVLPVGGQLTAAAYGEGALWVANSMDGSGFLSQIDPMAIQVVATVKVEADTFSGPGVAVDSIAAGDGSVWVGSQVHDRVRRLDPTTFQFTGEWVEVGWPAMVALGEGAAWTLGYDDAGQGAVFELHISDGTVVSRIPLAQPWTGIAAGGGAVWLVILTEDGGEQAVVKVDAATREIAATIDEFPKDPLMQYLIVAFGEGSLWVTGADRVDGDGWLFRIDPQTAEVVASIRLDMLPTSLAVGEERVWVAGQVGGGDERLIWPAEGESQVHVIDTSTNTVTGGPIVFDEPPSDIAVGGGALWVSHADAGTVTRIGFGDIP